MNFLGSFLNALKPRFDDDIVDRLNYYYTCLIILILAITISAKQYVGQPIQCWVPAQFTGAWEQYAENYCFVQNTYWLPLKEPVPTEHKQRIVRQIGYYQWVPFILAIEALLFYVPCVLWRLLNWQSGINVQSVVTMAADTQNIGIDTRQRAVKTISRHIEDALELQREFHHRNRDHTPRPITELAHLWRKTLAGTYVTSLYLVVKLMYLANVTGQFFLLSSFLNPRYRFWGAEILIDLANGREWMDSGHFPRVTMCDFEVRVLGNLHRYTIQCVLMINMFNEKIFLFLWWWFLFVAVANVLNLIYWLVICLSYRQRGDFVERYLRVGELLEQKPPEQLIVDGLLTSSSMMDDERTVRKFVANFLRFDGVFMLRMISTHAGDLITTEIATVLWKSFFARYVASPYAAALVDQRGLPNPFVAARNKSSSHHRPSYSQQNQSSTTKPRSSLVPLFDYPPRPSVIVSPTDTIVVRQAKEPMAAAPPRIAELPTQPPENQPSTDPGFIEAYYKKGPDVDKSQAEEEDRRE